MISTRNPTRENFVREWQAARLGQLAVQQLCLDL